MKKRIVPRKSINFFNEMDHDVLVLITPKKERLYFKKPNYGTYPGIINYPEHTYPIENSYPSSWVIPKNNMTSVPVEYLDFLYIYVFKYPIDWDNYNKKNDLKFTITRHDTEYHFNELTFVHQYRSEDHPEDFEDDGDENKTCYCF